MFDDGETEAGAAVGAAAGAVDGVEALEDAFLVFFRDAAAGVGDFEDEFGGLGEGDGVGVSVAVVAFCRAVGGLDVGADGDGSAAGGLDGVVDEVFEGEGDEAFVAAEGLGVGGEIDVELDLFFLGVAGVHAGDHVGDLVEIEAVVLDDGAAVLGAGEVEEILDHELEAEGVVVDDVDAAASDFGIAVAFLDGFDGGADGSERGAELVAGVGDEVGFHLEGAGDLGDVAHEQECAAVVGAVVDGGGGGEAVDGAAGGLDGELCGDGFAGGEGVAVEGAEVGVVDDGFDVFAEEGADGAVEDACGGGVGEADHVHVVGGDGDFVGLVHDGEEGEEVVFVLLGDGGAFFEFFGEGVRGAGEFTAGAGEEGVGAAGVLSLGHVGDEVEYAGECGGLDAVGPGDGREGHEERDADDDEEDFEHGGSLAGSVAE